MTSLSPELQALLDAERARPDAAIAAHGRVLSRVQASIAAGHALPLAAHASVAATGRAIMVLRTVVTLAVGAGVGAAAHTLFEAPPPVRIVTVPIILPAADAGVVLTPADATPLVISAAPEGQTTIHRTTTTGPELHDRDLAAERAVIESARSALARGNHGDALAALAKHRTQFPTGSLAEERDSLVVVALVASGQFDAARTARERFHLAYPSSLFAAVVDQAVETIP